MENQEPSKLRRSFSEFIKDRFNLDEDRAEQSEVMDNIKRGVEFRGTNLWVLIFAVVIASVGLNVNSTAVIIGAMLISPLMGPIMGIGLALGIYDFELLKKSSRNFLYAVVVSLVVSTLYFWVSPISIAHSELLARTTPTIWDVLIATFGGLAGIVAQSRRDRSSTVIPGVAIATALMPPLCTAGFGLATGNWAYFGGALYLFCINAVFIAFATFFIVRFLKYDRKQHLDPVRAKRVRHYMAVILTATLVPSIILAYGIVERTIFETSAAHYVEKVLVFENSEVINSTITYASGSRTSTIEVVMIGAAVSAEAIASAKLQLPHYNLNRTELIVRQATGGDELTNATLENVLRSNTQIIDEKNELIKRLQGVVDSHIDDTLPVTSLASQMYVLWSEIKSVALSKNSVMDTLGRSVKDIVICMVTVDGDNPLSDSEQTKLKNWLARSTNTGEVKLIIENSDQ